MNDKNDSFCNTRATLLLRVKNQQDEKSWEDFVFYYKKFIYIICRRMGLNHHDGEEVVQKVLLKLWNKLPEFDYNSGDRFRGWLCMMTGNTVKDFFRSHSRAEERKVKAADYEAWNPDVIAKPAIDKLVSDEWKNYISNMALENVRTKFSDKVIEVYLKSTEGVPVKELSEEIDVPVNTIYVYAKRVKSKLYEEIRRLCEELD
ncbi:MAG: RNA polymerase sigma factor [Lentisphaeraceae bacterium]|nr:RNA polymerase sigma factor [Lentisphaeraceae bacterium]